MRENGRSGLAAGRVVPARAAVTIHAVDLLVAVVLTLFTEGPNGPFFVFFANGVEEIYLRIREDSPGRAAEWRQGLLEAAQALNQFPRRYPFAPESGPEFEIRQLVYGAYRILFTVARHSVYGSCLAD